MNTSTKALLAATVLTTLATPVLAKERVILGEVEAKPAVVKKKVANHQQNTQYISREQALNVALEKIGGGIVDDVDFEYSRRWGAYYEVEIYKDNWEYEVKVDAVSGKVLSVTKEWD